MSTRKKIKPATVPEAPVVNGQAELLDRDLDKLASQALRVAAGATRLAAKLQRRAARKESP